MKAKPGDTLYYHGKPWAVLIALDREHEYTWRTHVPSIEAFYTAYEVILVDRLPQDNYSITPRPETLSHIIRRNKQP